LIDLNYFINNFQSQQKQKNNKNISVVKK